MLGRNNARHYLRGRICWFKILIRFMNSKAPPSLPQPPRASSRRRDKLLVGIALIPAIFMGALILSRFVGLVRPFYVPTGAMEPAVSGGDHVAMENITFLTRDPHRGDIVVFKSDGIALLTPSTLYIKRIAGEPGDRLKLSNGQLFINDKLVILSNAFGKIVYNMPPHAQQSSLNTNVAVPEGCYFLLGDNATNSLDSRFWGSIPRENIVGRILFCYWPPQRVGRVK